MESQRSPDERSDIRDSCIPHIACGYLLTLGIHECVDPFFGVLLLPRVAGCASIHPAVRLGIMTWGIKTVLLGIAVVASIVDHGFAADLKAATTKDGRVVVSISVEISEGDVDTLKTAVKAANDAGKFVSSIRLNSQGGNLLEG